MLAKINHAGFHLRVKFTLAGDQLVFWHRPGLDWLLLFGSVLLFVGSTAIGAEIVSDRVQIVPCS
jgi:hypothetical protein